jgi:hypothetical protein
MRLFGGCAEMLEHSYERSTKKKMSSELMCAKVVVATKRPVAPVKTRMLRSGHMFVRPARSPCSTNHPLAPLTSPATGEGHGLLRHVTLLRSRRVPCVQRLIVSLYATVRVPPGGTSDHHCQVRCNQISTYSSDVCRSLSYISRFLRDALNGHGVCHRLGSSMQSLGLKDEPRR